MDIKKLFLIAVSIGFFYVGTLGAVPIQIPITESVNRPRSDFSTLGLCRTAVHNSVFSFPDLDNADSLLYLAPGLVGIDAKNSSPTFTYGVNMRGPAPTSVGPFGPTQALLFPYSSVSSNPPATTTKPNENIAIRLRGYINITKAQVVDFLLGCDDQCRFFLGTSRNKIIEITTAGQHVAKPVQFQKAGLYPVEILYFQKNGDDYLDWAWAINPTQLDDGVLVTVDTKKYQIIPSQNLFTSITESSRGCQECQSDFKTCPNPGMTPNVCTNGLCDVCNNSYGCGENCTPCAAGQRFCIKGICAECIDDSDCINGNFCDQKKTCQPCNVSSHCGPACGVCTATTPSCKVDHCVGCTTDEACSNTHLCDTAQSVCIPQKICIQDSDCTSGFTCNVDRRTCVPTIACAVDIDCPLGRVCDPTQHLCFLRSIPCSVGCNPDQYCDEHDQTCKLVGPQQLIGGVGCHAVPTSAIGMLGIVFLILSSGLYYTNRRHL